MSFSCGGTRTYIWRADFEYTETSYHDPNYTCRKKMHDVYMLTEKPNVDDLKDEIVKFLGDQCYFVKFLQAVYLGQPANKGFV